MARVEAYITNMDANETNFWNSYVGGSAVPSELSAANLQSFANLDNFNLNGPNAGYTNDGILDLANQISGNNTSSPVDSPLSSGNNLSRSIHNLDTSINKTQSEILSIKQELDPRAIPSIIENNSNNFRNDDKEIIDKRKVQNRAAQRAFRERKEQKLKVLEGKLSQSEKEKDKILEELNKLKLKNYIITTENQMLLKTTGKSQAVEPITPDSLNETEAALRSTEKKPSFKFTFPKLDISGAGSSFSQPLGPGITPESERALSEGHKLIYENPEKTDKLLSTAALWDYLNSFETLNPDCELNIAQVVEDLRGSEKCYGRGPGFPLTRINTIILDQLSK